MGTTQPNAPQGIAGGVSAVASAVPYGQAAISAIKGVISIVSMFSGHDTALRNEADLLNQAVPVFSANLQAIFAALQRGEISEDQAKQAIDNAVADYYAGVTGHGRGSIRGKGTINGNTCQPGPKVDPCNAACVIGYQWVEIWACNAKYLIDSGGMYTGNSIPANGGIMAQPGVQLSYQKGTLGKLGFSPGSGAHIAIGVGTFAVVGIGALLLLRH